MTIPKPKYLLDELKNFILFAYNIFGTNIQLELSFDYSLRIVKVIIHVHRDISELQTEMDLLHHHYARLSTLVSKYVLFIVMKEEE